MGTMKCPCCNAALEVIDAELVEVPACAKPNCYNRQEYLVTYLDGYTQRYCKYHTMECYIDNINSIVKL